MNENPKDMSQLQIYHTPIEDPVLWGVEKTGSIITYAHPYWRPISNDDSHGTSIPGMAWSVLAGGQAQTYNLMVNNVIGTNTFATASVSILPERVAYNFAYATPEFILLIIWIPLVAMAIFSVATRRVTPAIATQAINQTSVGRVVMSMTGKHSYDRDPSKVSLRTALSGDIDQKETVHTEENIELEENFISKS
ncbi:hypothetical protein BGW37DRAFT_518431 [Umbelopsis sp. PMI_123]|nr:hypothetical protein BGW37DRAFT_518431 [Umbelopsis sp. PMI_123]